MKSRAKFVLSFFVFSLFLSFMLFSQTQEKGDISGTVIDEQGAILPGATITLQGEKLLQKAISAVSNQRGGFRFLNLTPGVYKLGISLPGFNTLELPNVPVNVGKTTPVQAKMTTAKLNAETTVIATAPLIETKTPQLTTSFSSEVIETTPSRSRDFKDIMNAAPGFYDMSGFGAGGNNGWAGLAMGSATTGFQLNGVDVGKPDYGYTTVNPLYETIEEIQVIATGASAEYGNFIGASVNVVTKSGTNDFHGSLSVGYTGGRGWFADNSGGLVNLKPDSYKYDVPIAGTFSGPLIREKLFFFLGAGYEDFNYKRKGGSPFYESNQKQQYYAKVDWLVNNRNAVTLLWNGNPVSIKNRHVLNGWQDSTGYDFPMQMNTIFASWNSTLAANSVLYVKLAGYKDNITKHMYAPDVPMYYDASNDVYYGGFSEMMRDYSQRIQVNAALTHYADDFLRASHEFKVGVEYERSQAGEWRQYTGGGYFQSYNYEDGTTLWYAEQWAGRDNLGKLSRFCAFVQDDIKIGKKFFFNLGVRFENPRLTARYYSGTLAKFNLFSPRVGFSYDLGGDARNVFHASYGRYYNKPLIGTYYRATPGNNNYYFYETFLPTAPFDTSAENLKAMLAYLTQPEFLAFVQPQGTPVAIDPNLTVNNTDTFNVGFEKQFGANFVLSIDYIYKRDRDRYQYTSSNAANHVYSERQWTDPWLNNTITVWDQVDSLSDDDLMLTNSKLEKKNHHLIMIVLKKQQSRHWAMTLSYFYQNSKGNTPGLDGEMDIFGESYINFDTDPQFSQNTFQYGPVWNRTHQIKLLTSYLGPWGLSLSADLRIMSALQWETQVSSRFADVARSYGWVTLFLDPRGSHRPPASYNLNLRVAKIFKIKTSQLELQADMFNLFNSDYYYRVGTTPYGVYSPSGISNYGKPTSLFPPRTSRIGLTWRF
ncbi:MAG: TonB-dependent receptor [Candidatus Aminicenantes bacterium]|nr:TonB-dependent receptor [Candidatus Aminicenantes bacterium]